MSWRTEVVTLGVFTDPAIQFNSIITPKTTKIEELLSKSLLLNTCTELLFNLESHKNKQKLIKDPERKGVSFWSRLTNLVCFCDSSTLKRFTWVSSRRIQHLRWDSVFSLISYISSLLLHIFGFLACYNQEDFFNCLPLIFFYFFPVISRFLILLAGQTFLYFLARWHIKIKLNWKSCLCVLLQQQHQGFCH